MLLPLHILETIDYYKHDISLDCNSDIITLYFKSKWKFSREIKLNRLTKISTENKDIINIVPSQSTLELLEQLENFINNRNKLIYFNREQYIELLNFTLKYAKDTFKSYDDYIVFLQSFSNQQTKEIDFPDNVIPFKPKH